ncbi:MAG TPA: ATP-dependent metallopeptidase FtsH/Yme1/Tma family protein, partial [Epsilonproteobacteria bacterium]|nr:ATP-dependent metallopeptidase FtsH/Yme1/Tma family protein [Campylobacterota bacterium]
MKATKQKFKPALNTKNIKIIIGLLIVLVLLLSFAILRDTDPLLTHKQANTLFKQDKIQKLIIDGEYIRIQTEEKRYKIYKDTINKDAFFTKYPVEVIQESSYLYDIFSLLVLLGTLGFLYTLMKQNRIQQLKQIKATHKTSQENTYEPVQALTSHVTFNDVAGIKDV